MKDPMKPNVALLLFHCLSLALASTSRSSELFKVEPWMRNDVEFWTRIYSKYTLKQSVIHDTEYLDKIYEITTPRQAKARIAHWRQTLKDVAYKIASAQGLEPSAYPKFSKDEQKVIELWQDVQLPNGVKYLSAAGPDRMRSQLGQKERFFNALMDSGRYLSHMESMFATEGLPTELTRIPFVESSFQLHAKSSVGAVGVWQFMKPTALQFMRVDAIADEREDPIVSSRAAARLLKQNYALLKSWPLAIMAYNHGTGGVSRAVRAVGSNDFQMIWKHYLGPGFGFASRNFYFEFLAALEVERDPEKYFGRVDRAPTMSFSEVLLLDPLPVKTILETFGFDRDEFKLMNRGLTESVYSGARPIPSGFKIRVPMEATRFYERYREFQKERSHGKS